MSKWWEPWTLEESKRMSGTLWPLGIGIAIGAAGMQLGMMIGAETTTVFVLPEALTPGWFGPQVATTSRPIRYPRVNQNPPARKYAKSTNTHNTIPRTMPDFARLDGKLMVCSRPESGRRQQ